MATVHPLRALRFNPAHVQLSGVLAPPYDVISPAEQEELYARDLRNIVRIDHGLEYPGDVPGSNDRYSRAAGHLAAWISLGILVRDQRAAFYVDDHSFDPGDGRRLTRRGLYARVSALPWERSEVLPHERTLRGPKLDRLALMRATRTQTSAVFALWDRAPGLDELLDAVTGRPPDLVGEHPGQPGGEHHSLWVVDDPEQVGAIAEALQPSRLYVADGHHRFETAAAYAAERRAAEPKAPADADFTMSLVHLCAARDPAIVVLPTHRLVLPGAGVPATLEALAERLPSHLGVERQPSLAAAVAAMPVRRATDHVVAALAADGAAVITAPRTRAGSPRSRLDVSVLQDAVLVAGCGLDAERIAGGALAYTRHVETAAAAVGSGSAVLAFCLDGPTTSEIIEVSDAGETMPQKSTYFSPKVPAGLVLSPL